MGVRMLNHSDKDYIVGKGDRVAQLVLYPLVTTETSWSETVHETKRGEKGFGSSGN